MSFSNEASSGEAFVPPTVKRKFSKLSRKGAFQAEIVCLACTEDVQISLPVKRGERENWRKNKKTCFTREPSGAWKMSFRVQKIEDSKSGCSIPAWYPQRECRKLTVCKEVTSKLLNYKVWSNLRASKAWLQENHSKQTYNLLTDQASLQRKSSSAILKMASSKKAKLQWNSLALYNSTEEKLSKLLLNSAGDCTWKNVKKHPVLHTASCRQGGCWAIGLEEFVWALDSNRWSCLLLQLYMVRCGHKN